MKFLLIRCHSQIRRWLSLSAVALSIVFAAGCASPGPPHAPSLDLPEVVKDLTAERVGDKVTLHWTTPEKTTDHIAIKGTITAEICRFSVSASPATPACTVVKRLPVQSGSSHAEELLPPALTADPASLLAYRVQLFNVHQRSAGSSSEVFAAAGAAPPPVEQLRATSIREGIQLEWQQQKDAAPGYSQVQLDRHLVAPAATAATPAPPNSTSSTARKPTLRSKSRKTSPPAAFASAKPQATSTTKPETPDDVKLETPKRAADAGGTIDQTTQKGESYRYTARRVREISLAGHALEVRSELSAPVTVAMLDTFPPAIPTGLEAVPGGATASDRSIDLSWTPDTDPDLAGYSVYRQEVTSTGQVAGPATRLNPSPIVGPAYRDQTAIPGHRYAYRVTAVDATGNESAPSADVQETLREQ
ncbi:fibronectin type III domain-containing protein [Tunturiibacter gelidoferens]|uniref:Fibronectin type 3 domain-containing protein n=1 Tax=Tunturiibacter gelidiferens TaxID=3069689 RepID=A0ACC5P141_9BACT|nr:fibronectin type III domain-containing protein [Edaphobacter lichenicola]MBB5340547.1 fibronectin type 3 domain-containing protein [Edaphobacter lichenicola]